MKLICNKSNIEFTSSGFNFLSTTVDHPIFSVPYPILRELGSTFHATYITKQDVYLFTKAEKRLLFLSLLYSTNLAVFKVAAIPSEQTIENNFNTLLKTVDWIHSKIIPYPLPSIIISHEHRDLKNISVYLNTWNDIRIEWERGAATSAARASLASNETFLLNKITQRIPVDKYAKHLGQWALIASGAPKNIHAYWMELFTLQDIDVYTANTTDLEELLDHMTATLIDENIYATRTLEHIRSILDKNVRGIAALIQSGHSLLSSIPTNNQQLTSQQREEYNTVEGYYIDKIRASAPKTKPIRIEYSNDLDYYKALAMWNTAQY